jgi:hypothetical protein
MTAGASSSDDEAMMEEQEEEDDDDDDVDEEEEEYEEEELPEEPVAPPPRQRQRVTRSSSARMAVDEEDEETLNPKVRSACNVNDINVTPAGCRLRLQAISGILLMRTIMLWRLDALMSDHRLDQAFSRRVLDSWTRCLVVFCHR